MQLLGSLVTSIRVYLLPSSIGGELLMDKCGGLKENGPHRGWHYKEVWLVGLGVALLEEVGHCGSRL